MVCFLVVVCGFFFVVACVFFAVVFTAGEVFLIVSESDTFFAFVAFAVVLTVVVAAVVAPAVVTSIVVWAAVVAASVVAVSVAELVAVVGLTSAALSLQLAPNSIIIAAKAAAIAYLQFFIISSFLELLKKLLST